MKILKNSLREQRVLLEMFAILLILISCQDTSLYDGYKTNLSSPVRMSALNFSEGDVADKEMKTRSYLIPDYNGTKFSWTTGDVAGVYSSGKGLTNFFIDDESISDDGTSATFNGSGFSLKQNTIYYAFYPYSAAALDKTNIPIRYSGQNITNNGDFKGLADYDYMWSRGVTDSEGNVDFPFLHLGCVVELKLEAPVSAIYTQVRLELENSTDKSALVKNGIVDITTVDPIINSENVSPTDTIMRLSLNKDEGIKILKDSILHVYMMMAPQNISSKNVVIRLVDNNNKWYSATMAGKNMKAGYTYHYYVGKNSSMGGFTGKGVGLPDDYEYKFAGSYIHPIASSYEDILVNGNIIYAIGNFGIRKIDFKNESDPSLQNENISITDNYTRARSIVENEDYLYVNVRQNSWGTNEIWKPQIKYNFEKKFSSYTQDQLSNNNTINAFFEKFDVKRDVTRINSATIYKAYKRTDGYRNAIVVRVNGEKDIMFLGKTYTTRESAINALENQYTSLDGDYCEVNWNAIGEGANDLKNLKFYFVKKAELSKSLNTSFDTEGNPSPNQGFHSGRFRTSNISKTDQVTIRNSIAQTSEGWFSFWLNVPKAFSQIIKCPLTYNGTTCLSRLNLIPTSEGYKIGLGNIATHDCEFKLNTWYNIKVHLNPNGSELYYRGAECTNWETLDKTTSSAKLFDIVSIGISTEQPNAEVLIDDFYFDETDVDKVSYVNGKVFIISKSDLSIKNKINLDYRVTGLALANDVLVVSGLYNVKFYDVSYPNKPKHLYTYQPSFERDMQGVTTFKFAGHTYAFVCCYSTGFLIWDITDKTNIHKVSDEDFSDVIYNGSSIKTKLNCFSCVVDYPYAYLTISSTPYYVPTHKNAAGVLTLNISDFSNVSKELTFIPSSDITDNTSGDPSPTRIARYGNTLYLNNRDKGIAIFDLINKKPVYRETYKVGNSINPITIAPDGRMFVGDDSSMGGQKNLYLIRIE